MRLPTNRWVWPIRMLVLGWVVNLLPACGGQDEDADTVLIGPAAKADGTVFTRRFEAGQELCVRVKGVPDTRMLIWATANGPGCVLSDTSGKSDLVPIDGLDKEEWRYAYADLAATSDEESGDRYLNLTIKNTADEARIVTVGADYLRIESSPCTAGDRFPCDFGLACLESVIADWPAQGRCVRSCAESGCEAGSACVPARPVGQEEAKLRMACIPWDQEPPVSLTPGGCGLDSFAWLPSGLTGRLLGVDRLEDGSIDAWKLRLSLWWVGLDHFSVHYGAKTYRLRYTTQDKGRSVEASGLIVVPKDTGERRHFPMVLYLHGTTGLAGECGPSGDPDEGSMTLMMLMASQGYLVVAPDYIGLDPDAASSQARARHAYLNIEQAAIGSLDMLRAANEAFASRLAHRAAPTSTVVLWGASQGGHAVFAVDLLAPFYAPEFTMQAAVALVPGNDLLSLTTYGLSDLNRASPLIVAALAAMDVWYEGGALGELLTDHAPWHFASRFVDAVYSDCDAEDIFDGVVAPADFIRADALAAIQDGRLHELEPWSCYLRENSIAQTSLPRLRETPTLYVVSENDRLVYAPVQRNDFDRLCDLGYQLDYLECKDADHGGALWSLPEQFEWVADRLQGESLDPARICRRSGPVRCSAQPDE